MRPAVKAWGFWLIVALGLAFAAWGVSVRGPLPADAPVDAFSAGRAMADVRRVGGGAHPIGSAADDRVRAALLARMSALGLSPVVREGLGMERAKWSPSVLSAGTVRNLVGVLPGRDRASPAVLLMAHTDSVPNSPGAADDGAGVATALETARLLAATGPHARGVIVLLTDGEEAGLLGADAFFRDDPLRARVGAVVNLEARGDAGRTAMFETGKADGETVRLYARAARAPFANSLTGFLYHLLPNDTDFTHAYRAGLQGVNFAFTGDQLAYHTPLATPAHLSQQSLQNMGDQAAPVVRALADAPRLPAPAPDVAYFDVFGLGVVVYPPAAGWIVVAAAVALTGLAWIGVARRGEGEARSGEAGSRGAGIVAVLRGAGVALATTLAAALVGQVAGRLLDGAGYVSGYHLYRAFGRLFTGAVLLEGSVALAVVAAAALGRGGRGLAVAALFAALLSLVHGFDPIVWSLAVAVAGLLLAVARRPLGPWSGWLGALTLVAAVAVAVQALAPLAAPLLAWPLLLGAAAAALCAWAPEKARAAAFVAAGGVAVAALAALGGLGNALFTALGPGLPGILAPLVLLSLASLAPFAYAAGVTRTADAVGGAALALGLVLLLSAGFNRGTAARPALAQVFLRQEADGRSSRVAPVWRLDAWSRQTLATDGGHPAEAPLDPLLPFTGWTAPATNRGLVPPALRLARTPAGVRVEMRATGGGRELRLFVRSPAGVRSVAVQGRAAAVTAGPNAWAQVTYDAPPPAGVTVDVATSGTLEARLYEQRDGWPPGAAPPPRLPGLMPFRDGDTTLVEARAAAR